MSLQLSQYSAVNNLPTVSSGSKVMKFCPMAILLQGQVLYPHDTPSTLFCYGMAIDFGIWWTAGGTISRKEIRFCHFQPL